jgi:hypothetical protein
VLTRRDDLIFGQPAHAWVSGQLARAWGNDAFPAPSPREPVCLAAEQHDVGWADADLAPLLGDDGRPLSFMEYPRAEHVAIWRDAARRLLAQSRYAALLVSLHGTSLYQRVDPDAYDAEIAAAIRDYVAGQHELQGLLAAGLDPGEVDRNRRLLLAWDRLSLALCHGDATTLESVPAMRGDATIWVEPAGDAAPTLPPAAARIRDYRPAAAGDAPARVRDDRPAAAGGDVPAPARIRDDRAVPADVVTARFVAEPWPFTAERVVVGCEARRLAGPFADEDALRAALAAAPWVPLRWELVPA